MQRCLLERHMKTLDFLWSVSPLLRGATTSIRKALGTSDFARWRQNDALSTHWDKRTEAISILIEPGDSVLEFGAGRLALKQMLAQECKYTPSDLIDRGPGTIVCDLNALNLPEFPPHDVAVFSGVLEYVNDLPRLISHLSRCASSIVASYAVTDNQLTKRRQCGWVNDYSTQQLLDLFSIHGFDCDLQETWESQIIFRFHLTSSIARSRNST